MIVAIVTFNLPKPATLENNMRTTASI